MALLRPLLRQLRCQSEKLSLVSRNIGALSSLHQQILCKKPCGTPHTPALPQHQRIFIAEAHDDTKKEKAEKRWTDLSYEELIALIDGGDVQLFDVREPKELTESGMIHQATNLPLTELKDALRDEPEHFVERYHVSQPGKIDTNVVFYALGPIKSTAALELAHKVGYKKARHYPGGWEEWADRKGLEHTD